MQRNEDSIYDIVLACRDIASLLGTTAYPTR